MEFINTLKSYIPEVSFSDVVTAADRHLQTAAKHTAEFLDTHPGFATLLSPGTLVRRAAQKHADEILNYNQN